MPSKRKAKALKFAKDAKASGDDRLIRWSTFVVMYWPLLSNEQKDEANALFHKGEMPPSIGSDALPGMDARITMTHMGNVIKKYREAKKMDQKTFADLIGKKSSHISLIESGEKSFTVVDLFRVCKLLGIPPQEIFTL